MLFHAELGFHPGAWSTTTMYAVYVPVMAAIWAAALATAIATLNRVAAASE
jgi:hypothetical protein